MLNNMATKPIRIPDPILAKPRQGKMTFQREAVIIFLIGLLAGWFWMTWAMLIAPPVGLANYNFWRLLLPF